MTHGAAEIALKHRRHTFAYIGTRLAGPPLRMFRRAAFLFALAVIPACASEATDDTESTDDALTWEPISTVLGNPPNFAQLGNGNTMTVVSRAEGRGSKAGALVELYYPKYSADNLWDSYVGVASKGQKLRWAHQLDLTGQHVLDGTGLVQSDFSASGLTLRIEDVILQGTDAHVRHVIVTNTGKAPIEGATVTFYAYYTLKNFPEGDTLHLDPSAGALLQRDDDVAVATLADRAPVGSHCGKALWPLGGQRDARGAAEAGKLTTCTTVTGGATGVNGVLVHSLGDIPAGASRDISYAIGIANTEDRALSNAQRALGGGGFAARAAEDQSHWSGILARAVHPAKLPADAKPVFDRALITMHQHRVENGAFIAAPTLTSPVYRLVWPRDGSKTAIDLLEAGFVPEARSFFEFLEQRLLADGSFAINYYADGSKPFFDFGASGNENDQPAMLPWGVERVFQVTNDRAWLAARWPTIAKVASHMLDMSQTTNGLVKPSRDLWELETGSSWTYASGATIAGLESAARIATTLGHAAEASSYMARAVSMRQAMTALVTPEGYFARGIKGTTLDTRLEIANLALGASGFGIMADTDGPIARVGDLVKARLLQPGGGVKRYEGDRYYGGQPWPVAAAWLAMHELARGDRPLAEAELASMTRQARTTGSRMLGEQFDESTQTWVSAMPLVWSEAAYVRTALAVYR